jgi:pimeloyl-ACP methyl ester carboxylesterase
MPFADILFQSRALQIEYAWVGTSLEEAPTVVFLHEGLGSISMWRDFPERFCSGLGLRGLVFSRYGYGRSTPRPAQEALAASYLHDQAYEALPALLQALDVRRPWLLGHSDGASIALLYAARYPQQVNGVVVMAPHIFVEDVTLAGIRDARAAFLHGDLKARLARHHLEPATVFHGWNDTWLEPSFRAWNIEREVAAIRCPLLALQGKADAYGTLEQIRRIARLAPDAQALAMPGCGHAPHLEQPEEVLRLAGDFIRRARPD